MQTLSLAILIVAGLWLIGVGGLIGFRPETALALIDRMTASLEASNWRLQISEQGLRIVAGAALIVRAPLSKVPTLFGAAGWILVATSLLILLAPLRWHAAYGRLLLATLTPPTLRLLSPVPVLVGIGLIGAAL